MDIRENISLKPFNTLGIEANAAYFLTLKDPADYLLLLEQSKWKVMPKMVLGSGSNLLFTKDYPGLIIRNQLKGYEKIRENEDHVWFKLGSGENWHQFVLYCVRHCYGGVENLSLIPGTVGAAPIQNIGAYGVEMESVFESLTALHLHTGTLKTFYHSDCQFDYRHSIFKNSEKGQYLITEVTFRLNKKPLLKTLYGAIATTLKEMNLKPSVSSISHVVSLIRQQKLPDPSKIPNAGSFFKNPVLEKIAFEKLGALSSDIPHWPVANDKIKLSAAWLIEQCGWKGKRVGDAGVHQQHALVLVNHGSASGEEIKQLATSIQQSVQEQFGVTLTPEVNII